MRILPIAMEILDLRLLTPADLQPLLEEEKAVWHEQLRWDYSATAAMVLRFMEAHALSGYAVMEDGRAVGYSFYVLENYKGLIGDAFLRPAFRNGERELRLITHVLETLQATPAIRRIEAQLLNLDTATVRRQFLSHGFQAFDRQFLYLVIPGAELESPAEEFPALIEPWDTRCFQAASRLILEAYRGHVDSAISDQYQSQAGTTRFLENIIRYPGCGVFLPEASLLAFSGERSPSGGLCGMVLTSVVSDRVAHITQLCVAPELHGRGLGRSLIRQALEILRGRGFQGATLTVTSTNTAAMHLYQRLGFSALSSFPAFAWDNPVPFQRFPQRGTGSRP
jgi:ribosomal protein S18 acetylase RimI-like enzyme